MNTQNTDVQEVQAVTLDVLARYTVKRLEELNPAQAANYMINERTARRVNAAVAIVEAGNELRDGDIVIYTDERGEVYQHARAERATYYDSGWSLCLEPYTPHLTDHGTTSTSGGPWTRLDPELLRFVERRPARFWMWSGALVRAHSGIQITASVRVWEYRALNPSS